MAIYKRMTMDEKDKKDKKEKTSELTIPTPLFLNFYRDQYKRAVFSAAAMTLMNLICLFLIIFLFLQQPHDVYVPAEEVAPLSPPSLAISNYTITPRIPTDKPNFSDNELNEWLARTVIQLFSYDLQDYSPKLQKNLLYFLPEAQSQYTDILNKIAPFSEYTTKEVIISVTHLVGAPAVYDQGVANNQYYWIFDLPLQIEFFGSIRFPNQSMTLRITVIRTSMDNDVYGIKIASIVATNIRRSEAIISKY